MVKKEIHFYKYNDDFAIMTHSWNDVEYKLKNNCAFISTTQMGMLSTDLFDLGYRIFIHNNPNDKFEITLGNCERTQKCIRHAHNLFKLWKCNCFAENI